MTNKLLAYFQPQPETLHTIDYFPTLPSTQTFCHQAQPLPPGLWRLCLTDQQSAGYGQQQRPWQGEHKGLWMSLATTTEGISPNTTTLSLILALWLRQLLSEYTTMPITLKWPNDLWIEGKKIAGILVECATQGLQTQWVIGMGVNLASPPNFPWAALEHYTHHPLDPYALCQRLSTHILAHFQSALTEPSQYLCHWQQYDTFYGQRIRFKHHDQVITGIARSINEQGAFLLETSTGLQAFTQGQIQLDA